MSVAQRLGAVVVALFAVAFTRAPWLIRLLDPAMKRTLGSGSPAGPNALLTVNGRRTGRPRSTVVACLDQGERGLLQAAAADVNWVRNLRVSAEAMITRNGQSQKLHATELTPEAAGRVLHELLSPFPRSRLVRAVVGPEDRPPVAVLHYFRIRVDDAVGDYIRVARRQPVFELRMSRSGDTGSSSTPPR